ncbi:hypothetical protein BDV06DRAFT_217898 [Aspergillus oleicola]
MVHQRLAPQNPFPAALLDVFQAYLTLLAPPPGSPHYLIPPSSIVLLQLKRQNKPVMFHGQTIMPEVPAGLTLLSAVGDVSNCTPSYEHNSKTDLFPAFSDCMARPYLHPNYPTCALWPTCPPRADLYCEAGMLAHPLVSPAASEDWSGSCPIWMVCGEEQSFDAALMIAQEAHRQKVPVTVQKYENMPHTFFFLFRDAPQTSKVFADWARMVTLFASGDKKSKAALGASYIRAKGLVAEPMALDKLVSFTVEELRELMWKHTLLLKVPASHWRGRPSL